MPSTRAGRHVVFYFTHSTVPCKAGVLKDLRMINGERVAPEPYQSGIRFLRTRLSLSESSSLVDYQTLWENQRKQLNRFLAKCNYGQTDGRSIYISESTSKDAPKAICPIPPAHTHTSATSDATGVRSRDSGTREYDKRNGTPPGDTSASSDASDSISARGDSSTYCAFRARGQGVFVFGGGRGAEVQMHALRVSGAIRRSAVFSGRAVEEERGRSVCCALRGQSGRALIWYGGRGAGQKGVLRV
eukprot:351514-Chlamydomonas_euryale.AAC.1